MPRAILVFRLPQEDDEHQVAVDGWRWREFVRDLDNDLRTRQKSGDETNMSAGYLRNLLWERLGEARLTLWE